MITSNYQVDGDIYSYADKFFCDSHDDKPSNADAKDGLINGAILEETDTGKTYIFDKKANQWAEKAAGGGGGGGGTTTLAGLTDVDISNPSDGQTLVYDAASSKWVNGSGGGGLLVINISQIDGVETMDKTWQEIHDAAYAVARRHTLGEDYDVYDFTDIATIGHNIGGNAYYFVVLKDLNQFASDTANGYPVKQGSPLPGGPIPGGTT